MGTCATCSSKLSKIFHLTSLRGTDDLNRFKQKLPKTISIQKGSSIVTNIDHPMANYIFPRKTFGLIT